ncbi:hypothetical protein [Desulfoluna sp.]|uniref:hypothetical protein n=1 Tax=Desulfoluna sp. TaxID=2045199 RepID=UPI00262AEC5B|nr:hypothetical protein [Desulfoluna sp.]
MPFKEILLKKIAMGQRRQRVLSTLGPVGSGCHVDKKAMKALLLSAGFRCLPLRGLELYLREGTADDEVQTIFVLDNDLPAYHTTVGDVALRKEPTLKEMISIRNAMRILNDADVLVSRKETSVETVYQEGLSRLDLSFCEEDIRQLEYEGRAAVEWKDADAVVESLALFGELLGLLPAPGTLRMDHCHIRGRFSKDERGGDGFGPFVVYNLEEDTLRWVPEKIVLADEDALRCFQGLAGGEGLSAQALSGPSVIRFLAEEVLRGRV